MLILYSLWVSVISHAPCNHGHPVLMGYPALIESCVRRHPVVIVCCAHEAPCAHGHPCSWTLRSHEVSCVHGHLIFMGTLFSWIFCTLGVSCAHGMWWALYANEEEVIEDMHIAHCSSFNCISIAPLYFTYKTNASLHFDTFSNCPHSFNLFYIIELYLCEYLRVLALVLPWYFVIPPLAELQPPNTGVGKRIKSKQLLGIHLANVFLSLNILV